jgi:hypothetical protein
MNVFRRQVRGTEPTQSSLFLSVSLYEYTPLPAAWPDDSIRVVEIEPGSGPQGIVCRLRDVSLSNTSAKYDALSYCWGDSTKTDSITCDGRKFLITKNLRIALRRLRQKDAVVTIWIDQICIYSHRTATKHLGTMRFAPQFFEGFNFTHLSSQIWQYILPCF